MASKPNILFLFSDEHSFRCLGCLPTSEGGEPVSTPALDQLVMGGTYFSDAYCQMPLCTPSRLCTLTGREVRGAGAWGNGSVLRPELPTMGSLLRGAGYETCLVGKMHLGGSAQMGGFQHRPYGDLTGKTGHQWEPIRDPERHSMRARTAKVGLTEVPESVLQDQVVAHETVAWLREQHHRAAEQPWFLCASFSRPHFPLTAPRRWLDRYWPHGVTEPKVPPAGDAYDHPMSVGMRKGFGADAISQDEMIRARAAYFACVSYLDEVIGDLLLRLEKDQLLDNTIIVYGSDHGEMAGEHGVWWKNGWYEACTRIPLIISTPEQRKGDFDGRTVRTPVGLIDLLPTFCGFAGIDAPEGIDGIDLSGTVRSGSSLPRRAIACDNLTPRWGAGTEFRMLRLGDYKYVHFRHAPPLLFNVKQDPGEQVNLIASRDEADVAAREELASLAAERMDFDAADQERTERDGKLHQQYALDVDGDFLNLYHLRDDRVVAAEDMLYQPRVAFEDAKASFADWPDDSASR